MFPCQNDCLMYIFLPISLSESKILSTFSAKIFFVHLMLCVSRPSLQLEYGYHTTTVPLDQF